MADGTYKNIQDILVGERVSAYDIINNREEIASVSSTFVRPSNKYRIIHYSVDE